MVRNYKNNPNKWLIDISCGKKHRFREVFNGTYEEALAYERILKEKLSVIKKNKDFHNFVTISQIAPLYLKHVELHQSFNTFKNKKRMIEKHIIPFFGDYTFDMIKPYLVDKYKEIRLKEIQANQKSSKSGYREINLELLCLTNMSRYARENGYSNKILVIKEIKKLPYKRPLIEPLDFKTKDLFFEHAKSEPLYYCLFLSMYQAALRKDEALNLKWDDINFDSNKIFITKGKGNKQRIINMCSDLREALLKLYKMRDQNSKYIFVSKKTKKPLKDVRKAIKRICKRAGIKRKITPHLFRHTCATHLLLKNVDIRIIQSVLGHEDITTTTIYAKVLPTAQEEAIKKLESFKE